MEDTLLENKKEISLEQKEEIIAIITEITPGLLKCWELSITEEIETEILVESYIRCTRNSFVIKDDNTVYRLAVIIITKKVIFDNARSYKKMK